jgi:hypothetical protein
MQIDGLKTLYSNMQRQGIDRYRFCFKHGRTRFDVFFFTDREPFVLLFGVHGQNISFEIEVQTGFRIEAKLDKETYGKLCSVLGLVYDPHNHFSPATFFETFNRHIPTYVNHDHIVRPEELIQYCRNVEEPNKMWFCGWRDNTSRGQSVTTENLRKTRLLLGEPSYSICKERNISSCWTDDQSRAMEANLRGGIPT